MSDNNNIDKNKEVDFSYPEGFMEAVNSLDFLPDEQTRIKILTAIAIGQGLLH